MKNKLAFGVFLLILGFSGPGHRVFAQADIFAPYKEVIKAGNAKEMVKYFNQSMEMNLDGEVNTYSKAQAEFALRDFFKKHAPTDFSIMHTGSSKGGLQFAIGSYISGSEKYTVLIRVREVQGAHLIHEINFVKE